MELSLLNIILHLDVFLNELVNQYGVWIYAILFLVIFCETGLVVTPFLPGDSLLFIAGAVAAGGGMDPILLATLLMAAAILGDSTNYLIGRFAGDKLFQNPNSKIFRPRFLGFSVLGTVLWVCGLVALGYFFGNVPFIKKNLTLMIVVIILISALPMIIGFIRSRVSPTAKA
jgi:membrane-associated protein